jgi:hypothetical protein
MAENPALGASTSDRAIARPTVRPSMLSRDSSILADSRHPLLKTQTNDEIRFQTPEKSVAYRLVSTEIST